VGCAQRADLRNEFVAVEVGLTCVEKCAAGGRIALHEITEDGGQFRGWSQ
jgi:hypothetical protein